MIPIRSIDLPFTQARRPSFQIDWELTFFCNYDCSYCKSHDNTTRHPDKQECKQSIDFAFAYADQLLQYKKPYERSVTLNLAGGETLIHPDITEILSYAHEVYETKYKTRWTFSIHVVTNGSVGKNVLEKCLPLIDHWAVSYHCEANAKQKLLCRDTISLLKQHNKDLRVAVMMHSDTHYFDECVEMINWLTDNQIRYTPKAIGDVAVDESWTIDKTIHSYSQSQTNFLVNQWNADIKNMIKTDDNRYIFASAGRGCCSGQGLCVDSDRKNLQNFVADRNFQDWYCSVNWYFMYIDQKNKQFYHNRSCQVNTQNKISPLGSIEQAQQLLDELAQQLAEKQMPVIRCPKTLCGCGICAPKAKNKEEFLKVIKIHLDTEVLNIL